MKHLAFAILVLLMLAACDGSPGCHPPGLVNPFCTGTDGGNFPYDFRAKPTPDAAHG
jgi:hypothetical protein